jgi:hypothetical protein
VNEPRKYTSHTNPLRFSVVSCEFVVLFCLFGCIVECRRYRSRTVPTGAVSSFSEFPSTITVIEEFKSRERYTRCVAF